MRDPVDAAARTSGNAEFVEAVSNENVRQAVNAISERSEVLAGMQASGAINIVGAMYDVSDGSVAFFDDPS